MTLLRRLLTEQRARRARQDLSAFNALIAAPGNLVTGVALPANGLFYLTTTSALASAHVQVTCDGRSIGARAGAAGTYSAAGWFARASVVKKDAGATGTVSLWVQDAVGSFHKIAQG
jgi:hypothetical protein